MLHRGRLSVLLLLGAVTVLAAAPADREKTLITDGSMVHDAGTLLLNVSNFGLLGATPGATAPWSGAPSARWPGETGIDHLYAAGLWVGSRLDDGSVHVTTGQNESEIRSTDDPLDVIYAGVPWFVGGARYPDEPADSDADGLEDEDPLNGLDDDGDGDVDEDYAMIADQYFRCLLRDDLAAIQDEYPSHAPLGLEIVQETFQWHDTEAEGAVGMRFTVRNAGAATLHDTYLGFFADADIAGFEDDLGFTWSGTVDAGGEPVFVHLVGMKDGGGSREGGLFAIVPLGLIVNGVEIGAEPTAELILQGQTAYPYGDPVNDEERYHALSTPRLSPDTAPDMENDYRILISSRDVETLAPGDEVVYDIAMIAAGSLDGLRELAGAMAVIRRGAAYDRDGDPANGAEFVVRWLLNDDVVANEDDDGDVPQQAGLELSVSPNPFNPRTALSWYQATPGAVRLRVHDLSGRVVAVLADGPRTAGEHRVTWSGQADDARAVASGRYLAVLETADGRAVRPLSLLR